jgi:hypothetical protein
MIGVEGHLREEMRKAMPPTTKRDQEPEKRAAFIPGLGRTETGTFPDHRPLSYLHLAIGEEIEHHVSFLLPPSPKGSRAHYRTKAVILDG